MPPTIDPGIIKTLSLDPAVTAITKHGGSGFSTTLKLTSKVDGEEKIYFIKTGSGKDAETMFAGEHESLNAIHSIVPSFCPQSYSHGALSGQSGFFLATDFLDLQSPRSTSGSGLSFAYKLAKLHNTAVPPPSGFSVPQFGFPVPTCCGSTEQPNDYSASWADFFANERLRAIVRSSEKSNGQDPALRDLVEKVADNVVPRLLGEGHLGGEKGIKPAVIHGDLWSGNHGTGSIGKGGVEEVVYDPSSCYAHSEFDLGIMKMFGGFSSEVMKEYHDLKPKDEPTDEYDDRVTLYEAYHYLNHHAMFGGGYKSSAMAILRGLNERYGI